MMSKIRTYFLTGLIVTIPLVTTIYILWAIFNFLDGLLKPLVSALLGYEIPGLSLAVTLLIVLAIGAFSNIAFGKKIVDLIEKGLLKIPLVRNIYAIVKDASTAVLSRDKSQFKRVVLVQYPRKGIHVIGFTTALGMDEIQDKTKKDTLNIFIPTSPNPTSGMLIMVPKKDVIPLDMTIEEGIKLVVSGGFSTTKANKDSK